MFDLGSVRGAVTALSTGLSGIGEGSDDVERIDLIRALEELKCAAEGAQAVLTAAFDRSQRAAEAAAGVPVERQGRAVAAQVALARRESPHRGRQHVGLALVLRDEMPCTRRALVSGRITEWRATLLARETACLSREDRAAVDRRVAGDLDALEAMGDGELVGRAREVAYELDPVSFVERRRRAEADRRVTPASGAGRHGPALGAAAGQGRRRGVGGPLPGGRPGQGRRRPADAGPNHGRHPGRRGSCPAGESTAPRRRP